MKLLFKQILSIFLLAICLTSKLNAAVLTVEYSGFSQGSTNLNQTLDGTSRNAAAGMFDLDIINSDVPWINQGSSIEAFCVELDQFIITNTSVQYNIQTGMDFFNNSNQVELIGRLYSSAFDSVLSQTDASNQRIYSSAFQIAMWELVYDFDAIDLVDNGYITDTRTSRDSIRTLADSWLGNLVNVTNNYSFLVLQSDISQDLIVAKENDIPVSTPSLIGLIALALFYIGWRVKQP